MSKKIQFGILEDQVIELLQQPNPDFQGAAALLKKGADLNAIIDDDPQQNMLSEITEGYWYVEHCQVPFDCRKESCDGCRHQPILKQPVGITLIEIVKFFVNHGFDVTKKEGSIGVACLGSLLFATFDSSILVAAKILLDAGAASTAPPGELSELLDRIGCECGYRNTCENDHDAANLYEAYFQLLLAVEKHRPYGGVDWYKAAYGKKVQGVFASVPKEGTVFFNLNLPTSKHKNCFRQNLYFKYDGGTFVLTESAEIWTDTKWPDGLLTDVSDLFPGIVGDGIRGIHFDHREIRKGSSGYGQPIIILEMDCGTKAIFSINFGEVLEPKNRVAYYSLHQTKKV